METELVRARYRPEKITTLFVGESAPASGDFFYYGNSGMTRYMQRAMGHTGADFLDSFKARGWYLDDLCLEPIDALARGERRAKCLSAKDSLAARIAQYQPLAIVSVLLSIRRIVDRAALAAGCGAPRYAVPFPGNGQRGRFLKEIARIIPELPSLQA
jgi:hypothetical protein